jgi:hypothetical protein
MQQTHYKMYKSGKQWLVAAAAVLAVGLGTTTAVSADTSATSAAQTTATATVTSSSSTDYTTVTGAKADGVVAVNSEATTIPIVETTVGEGTYLTLREYPADSTDIRDSTPLGTYHVQGKTTYNGVGHAMVPLDPSGGAQPGDTLHFWASLNPDDKATYDEQYLSVQVAGSNVNTTYTSTDFTKAAVDAATDESISKDIPGGKVRVYKYDGSYRLTLSGENITVGGTVRDSVYFNALTQVPVTYHYYSGSTYMTGVIYFVQPAAVTTPAEDTPTTDVPAVETPATDTPAAETPAETTPTAPAADTSATKPADSQGSSSAVVTPVATPAKAAEKTVKAAESKPATGTAKAHNELPQTGVNAKVNGLVVAVLAGLAGLLGLAFTAVKKLR